MTVDTELALARAQGLGDLLRRSARRWRDKTAIIDGETSLSYAEFDTTVNRVANALTARGIRKGDRVALLARNSWQFAALSFATARLGALLVPINFMLGPSEVAYILDHSGASAFVIDAALADTAGRALELAAEPIHVRAVIGNDSWAGWEAIEAWTSHPDTSVPAVRVADDDPLRLMYTSGTESRPKGVVHTSRSLIAQYVSCIVDGGMTAQDIEVHAMPFYHCAQLDCFLSADLYLGATNIVLAAPEPTAVLAALATHRATKFFAPPTVWIGLLRSAQFDSTDLSALSKGYYGASAMPVEVLREIRERLPHLRLWNFYGQTEMAPVATILPPEDQADHPGSAGFPALNVETQLVDETGAIVPVGEVGEIVHRSPHATLGYWNDEAKTAEAFAGGWFHSGDLGVFDADGRLSVVDRKKDMIKTGGENVASREVEEVIYLHPAVAEAAVFGVADERWVERVVAVVVPREGMGLEPDQLIAHCRDHLAGYKTPKQVEIVDSLPKNPSGKILKRELRERFGAAAAPARR